MIETWVVLKQETELKKEYLAHIFKYTSNFPKAEEILNQFCESIKKFNSNNEKDENKIKLLKCLNDKVQKGNILGSNYYYWLFEKPVESYILSEICKSDCAKERICKYKMKEFIKGYIKSKLTPSKRLSY